jgi:nucleophosmin 1
MGKDLKELVVATLQKDKVETVKVDLYFNVSQNVTLTVSGAGELHLSGFFEP